jgi:hypothetical protein
VLHRRGHAEAQPRLDERVAERERYYVVQSTRRT